MLRLLHTASPFLDAPHSCFGAVAAARGEDFLHTFEQVLEVARREQASIFLVAGDLFATPRPRREILARVVAGLESLRAAGIHPVVLPGPRDTGLSADAVYRRQDLPGTILSTSGAVTSLEVNGRLVRFVTAGATPPAPVAGSFDIGVACAAPDALPPPFSGTWRPDYLALGGRGDFELLSREEIVYGCRPGGAEGVDFTETGARHAALVDLEPQSCLVRQLKVNRRLLLEREIVLSGSEDDAALAARVRAELVPEAALRLVLRGSVEQPIDLAALEDQVAGASFFLVMEDQTSLAGSRLVARFAAEDTVRGLCLRRALERLACAGEGEKELLEAALREILTRLQMVSGGAES
ncbi:DNA repair exonuclease [Desulfuromonas carbonis]|uniref:metallophosphoesterase family protein n=1 Tax=Desulfuromonas sp. DDH964 TaxID=1823759 RepID=UPI00078B3D7A|nr:hypothetical protein [Desulfuromonas sp. DDH964]AMV72161.1 DNA repair exonuclease SbcCD, D subunit [Desulfuromonas sp. DDH964]